MSEKKITEKDLIEFGFKKIEGDAGISFPYQKEVGEDLFLCITVQRNRPEFCILSRDGVLYLKIHNLVHLKVIEQSISDYEEN